MNSFINYIPRSLNDHKAFVEHMLSIIDTKLQFVKHSTNALISTQSPTLASTSDDPLLSLTALNSEVAFDQGEKIFTLIEKYSKTTHLLLLLRTKLTPKNVSLVYDLLNNDRFLDYESKTLERMLEHSMY